MIDHDPGDEDHGIAGAAVRTRDLYPYPYLPRLFDSGPNLVARPYVVVCRDCGGLEVWSSTYERSVDLFSTDRRIAMFVRGSVDASVYLGGGCTCARPPSSVRT